MVTEEIRLIRLLARLDPEAQIRDRINYLLKKDLDWDYFLDSARLEGIGGLLFKTIEADEQIKQAIPERARDQLRNIYYCNLRRNLILGRALEENADLLRSGNIELIIFKGLMLAGTVYRDPGMRPMSDIDVMARESDLERINAMLKNIGYTAGPGFSGNFDSPFTGQRNSVLYRKDNGWSVYWHLYWHLINSLPYDRSIIGKIDMEKVWRCSERIDLSGVSLRTFSLYHQIIYLCMHAMQHSFRPLILLCDINELIRQNRSGLDWEFLEKEAREFGLARYLYYGLFLSSMILELEVPRVVLDRLRPPKTSFFERRFIDSVLENEPNFAGGGMVYLGMGENIKSRFDFLFRFMFPSRKEMAAIRQKDAVNVNCRDYLDRLSSAFSHAIRFMINR